MLVVEVDNALGSRRGDVDDGLALAALLGHAGSELLVVSTYGNTGEDESDRNNRALAAVARVGVRHLRGCARPRQRDAEAVQVLCDAGRDARVLALGPLTTLAAALARKPNLDLGEVVVVGGDTRSRGRFPPLWPHEFNFCKDKQAAQAVFASRLPLTVVPLDVGRRLLLPRAYLAGLPGEVGAFLLRHTARRLARNRRWLRLDALRGYDLLAAATVTAAPAVACARRRVRLHRRGFLQMDRGREVRVVSDFDAASILAMLGASVARLGAQGSRGLESPRGP